MDNMTVLTKEMFERTRHINDVDEAVELLLNYQHFRTLEDVLHKFAPDSDTKKRLVAGLLEWFPGDKPDSIDRKVRNWLGGKTQSVSKQYAYIISRILKLSLEQTNEFLEYATGESIHWRNPVDIIWCYSIIHDSDPEATKNLLTRAEELAKSGGKAKETPDSYTAEVYEKLQSVIFQGEEALFAFLKEEQSRLGALHNTAYALFLQYMDILKKGYSDSGVESLFKEMTKEEKKKAQIPVDGDIGPHRSEAMSVRDILETYMYRKYVPVQVRGQAKSADAFSSIQRNIRQNWPDEFSLSKMESRKQDISRKTLILLFLATDGTDSDYSEDYDEYDDFEAESPDEEFLNVYTRLNMMLSACAFPQLDPRNPFDWMILFCISSGDLWESDARLQEILTRTYPAESA